jgi:hypothetical protein
MMPPQLARAKRPKRSTPRPLVEELPRIEIADLCRYGAFPSQYEWHARYLLELYPFLKNLVISLQNIEANHHSGYIQSIRLRWLRTGFGGNSRPRPLCQCGRSVTKLYSRPDTSPAAIAKAQPMPHKSAASAYGPSCKPNV